MKALTKTIYKKAFTGGKLSEVEKVIVHTATSCYMIETILCTIYGENAEDIADIIISQHNALIEAESFISGFEDDDMQEGVDETLTKIRAFDLVKSELPVTEE